MSALIYDFGGWKLGGKRVKRNAVPSQQRGKHTILSRRHTEGSRELEERSATRSAEIYLRCATYSRASKTCS